MNIIVSRELQVSNQDVITPKLGKAINQEGIKYQVCCGGLDHIKLFCFIFREGRNEN